MLFTNPDDMSRASLAIPIGTLGYVADQQTLYLRVPLGWQSIQVSCLTNKTRADNSFTCALEDTLCDYL